MFRVHSPEANLRKDRLGVKFRWVKSMMNFEATRKTTEEAQANLERAFTSLAQGIAVFQQIAGDLDANNLRQCLTTISKLLDDIEDPLTARRNVEDFKSQIDLLRPGISAHVPSVSEKKFIETIREALSNLHKLLSGWQGTLKAIQTFPADIQDGLTRVDHSALPDYSRLIATALKKVERLTEGAMLA
jgi:hypothetical protein